MKRANEEREQDRDRQRKLLQQSNSSGRRKTPATLSRTTPTNDMSMQHRAALENLRQNLSFNEGDNNVSVTFI